MKDTHEHNNHTHDHAHGGIHNGGREHEEGHRAHLHGVVDPTVAGSDRGLWAIKWSFVGLFITAFLQSVVFYFSNSVGLLADTIHNFADTGTAIPLGIAFLFGKMKPTKRFPFGYGRVEDLAGIAVVFTIFASAVVAAYESVQRLVHPEIVTHLGAVAAASIVGFIGNEAVAIFRIRVGKEIGSAALVADGQHARVDGWTSLAVLVGAIGVWFGYPLADPIVGLVITVAILFIVWEAAKAIFTRALDGIEPEVLDSIRATAQHVDGVKDVAEVRARWVGHRLNAEVNIVVDPNLSVTQAHQIARATHIALERALPFLSRAVIHVDPEGAIGETEHVEERTGEH